jgi:hypothetical protein
MRKVSRILGWIALVLAAICVALGLVTWPPGGLMFALPFLFLIPALFLGALGGVLLWIGRGR